MAEKEPTPGQELGADVRSSSHTGFWSRARNYFLTGLVVAGPVAITAWLVWSFVTWVDGFVRPFIPPAYRPETYLPWPLPGTGRMGRGAAQPHADHAAHLPHRETDF